MDTSEKYFQMYSLAHELRVSLEPRIDNTVKTSPFHGPPRVDTLLDMLKKTHTVGAVLQGLYEFYEPEHFCPDQGNELITCNCASKGVERRKGFESVEQFALAYVMDELYKKQWNGRHWVSRHTIPSNTSARHDANKGCENI